MLTGIGLGFPGPTLNSAMLATVPPHRGGMASGALNSARQLGFASGIAALSSGFLWAAADELRTRSVGSSGALARDIASGRTPTLAEGAPLTARASLAETLDAAAVSGVQASMVLAAVVGLLAGLAVSALVWTPAPSRTEPYGQACAEPSAPKSSRSSARTLAEST